MGNRLSCLNRDENMDNIIKRNDELNDEDFYIFENNDDRYFSNNYKDFGINKKSHKNSRYNSIKKNGIDYQKYKDVDKSDKCIICSLDNLKRSQIMKLKQVVEYFHQNGKPRSSDDFDPNNWKKYYSESSTYFHIKDNNNDIIHNQLKIYNPKELNNIRIYQGDLNKLGQRHGIGKYTTPYYVLIGMWKNDKFSGWGRESRCNGDVFEGKFVNGLINGKGFFMDMNKNKYIGDFINVKRWGKGKWVTDKINYEGEFYNNQIHGNGRIKFLKSGIEYIGTFKNDRIDGYGIFKWINGDKYEGEVKNGKMHGSGKYQYSNGQTFNGTFINGKIESRQERKNRKNTISPIKYDYEKDEYKFDNAFFNKINYSKKINNNKFKNYNTYNNNNYSLKNKQNEIDSKKSINKHEIGNIDFSKSLRHRNKINNYYLQETNNNNTYEINKGNRDYLINNNSINEQYSPIQENTEYIINNYDFFKTSKFKRSGHIENEKNDKILIEENISDNKYILDELGIFDNNKVYEENNDNNNINDFEKYLVEDTILDDNDNLNNKNNNINEIQQNKKNSDIIVQNINNSNDFYNDMNLNEYEPNLTKKVITNDNNADTNNTFFEQNNKNNFDVNNNLNNELGSNKCEDLQHNNNNNEYNEKKNTPEIKKNQAANILLSTYRNFGFGDEGN